MRIMVHMDHGDVTLCGSVTVDNLAKSSCVASVPGKLSEFHPMRHGVFDGATMGVD